MSRQSGGFCQDASHLVSGYHDNMGVCLWHIQYCGWASEILHQLMVNIPVFIGSKNHPVGAGFRNHPQ